MKRVIIICEGETEREFCKTLLASHFSHKNIHIQAPLIKRSMGGIVRWEILRKEIETYLREKETLVTTLIDYYGMHSKYKFPEWEESININDKNARLDHLESAMKHDVNESLNHRFIPYMQLHEFEGLLFNNIEVFYAQIPKNEIIGVQELEQTFKDYPDNPEMINNNKDTSPSSRLMRIISGYNKPLYGHYLAEAIGLEKIRNKSPRFNAWLNKIEGASSI